MNNPKDCCYEEMTKGKVFEDSETPYLEVPYVNEFENSIHYGKGYNQSGMKGK